MRLRVKIFIVFMAALLAFNTSAAPTVNAGALTAVAAEEGLMLLWNLMMNAFVAAGVVDIATGKNTALQEKAAQEMYDEMIANGDMLEFTLLLEDGTETTLGEVCRANGITDGTSALQAVKNSSIPNLRIMEGGNNNGDFRFNVIQSFAMNYGVVNKTKELLDKYYNSDRYYGTSLETDPFKDTFVYNNVRIAYQDSFYTPINDGVGTFHGIFEGMVDGDARLDRLIMQSYPHGSCGYSYGGCAWYPKSLVYDATYHERLAKNIFVGVFTEEGIRIKAGIDDDNGLIAGTFHFLWYEMDFFSNSYFQYGDTNSPSSTKHMSSIKADKENDLLPYCSEAYCDLNIPLFKTEADAVAFYQNYYSAGKMDFSRAINASDVNKAAAIENVPLALGMLAGITITPDTTLDMYKNVQAAIENIPEEVPKGDVFENVVTDTIKDTVQQANPEPEPEPNPDPDPEPNPEPDPDPEPAPDVEDVINSGKVDLTDRFPFCLPFDYIRLLNALSADAETPRFEIPFRIPQLNINETVVIDLAWLDNVMKIFRIGETGLFIIMLIKNTPGMIKH